MTTTCPKTLPRPILPALPTVILRLIEATDDEKKSVKELADLASKDPSLCSQILKIANSALVNPGSPIKSITQAALNLGIPTLRHVAITAGICQTFTSLEVPENFSLGDFWNHCISCALLCKEIVASLDLPFSQEEAFLAGLLHDIGQLSLIMRRPELYDKIVQNPRTGQTVLESEAKIWGWDHTVEGYELVKQWNLPISIRTAVRFHHKEPKELSESTAFLRIVYLADITAHYLNRKCSISISELLSLFQLLGFSIKQEELERVLNKTETTLKTTAKDLGLSIEQGKETKLEELPETRKHLRDKNIELATLIGVLESLLTVRSRKELHDALFSAIASLTEIQSGLLFRYQDGCLKGVCARGTEDDSLASQIHVTNIEGSIWNQAFTQGRPIFSEKYFKGKPSRIIDLQLKEYINGEFIAVPLTAGSQRIGALALRIEPGKWPDMEPGLGLIQLLAREVANILRGISYRNLWEKEHILNDVLVKKCPIGIVITDHTGRINYVNPAAKELLEIDSSILFEDQIAILFQKDIDIKLIRFKKEDQAIHLGNKRIELPSGKTMWLEVQAAPLQIGNSDKLLFFIRDITDSVLLETERQKRALWLEKELIKRTQELKKAQEKLIQSERLGAASEVARKVVHEVNNPLGIIKNLLKILKIQKETGKIEDKTIDAIGSEIDRVARIVRKLSDFSRQKSKTALSSKRSSVGEVLSEIEALVGPGLSEKGITLHLDVPEDLPAVAISKDELKQIFINLFKNSEEAMGENGEIFVRAYQSDGKVVIEFGDTGPGVNEQVKGKIFSPFVTTKGKENSGLGLSVCFGLLEACGGDISLTDREGFGAFFLIRIPVANRQY